jgi:hypothetical protein
MVLTSESKLLHDLLHAWDPERGPGTFKSASNNKVTL